MYNRYIPNGAVYTRIPMEDGEAPASSQELPDDPPRMCASPNREAGRPSTSRQGNQPFSLPSFLSGVGKNEWAGVSGLLKKLKLDNLDSGDILLLLIVLFLLLEGDDLELVIALGLVLILGIGDGKDPEKNKERRPDGSP